MELSAKVLDLEQLEDSKRKQDTICKSLQDEITRAKEEFSTKINEYESLLNEVSQVNEKSKTDILELQQNLSAKTKELEKLATNSISSTESTEKLINEFKQTIHERDKEIIKLKDDFEQETANFNIKHCKIAEEHKKEIEDRNSKIEQLIKEIESHKQSLDQRKVELDALNSQFNINADELKSLKEENEKLKHSVVELTQNNNELKSKISAMELEVGELRRQLESSIEKRDELQKSKDKVESEYMNLTGQTTDSNEQFNKLSQHLKESEKELQDLKDKNRESTNNFARMEQEIKQNLFKIQEDFALERTQLVASINEYIEKFKDMENKAKEMEVVNTDINNRLKDLQAHNDNLLDETANLKKEIEALKVKEHEQMTEHDALRKKLEIDIDRYKVEISLLKAEGATSEVRLIEKVDQLTEAQNDLNNKLEESRTHEDSLQKILDDMTTQLNNQKAQHEKELSQVQHQISTLNEDITKSKAEEQKLTELVEEKQNSIKDLTLKLEMLEVDLKSNIEIVAEKDRQTAQVSEELSKTTEAKNILEDKLNNVTLETSTLKQKYENLIAESTAEDSLMKEQIGQLETLRKEMSVLAQDKSSLEVKYNETISEFDKLRLEHEDNINKLNENITNSNELKKSLEEKDNLLKSQSTNYESEINKLNALEKEIAQLRLDASHKDAALHDKEFKLAQLNSALEMGTNETQTVIAKLQTENAELLEKHKQDVESLNTLIKTIQSKLTDSEKMGKEMSEELKQTKDRINVLQQQLNKSDSDVKQLTNINEAQKMNYEDLNKQLKTQYDEYKKESKHSKHELKAKLQEFEKEIQESKDKVKAEKEKQNEVQQKLTDAEKSVADLSQKLELINVQQSTDIEKDSKLEKLSMELHATKKALSETIADSETLINNLRADVEAKVKDLKKKEQFIGKLEEEIKVSKMYSSVVL